MDYPNAVTHTIVQRDSDRKLFTSSGGQANNGKQCRPLRALTPTDADFAAEWDKEIGKTVVELEDGTKAVLLNDELKG